MKIALEQSGISFRPGGAVMGAPPKFETRSRVPQDRVAPIRWIVERDLDNWADSRFGQESFPELIRRLILAEVGYHPELRFPSRDAVSMHGWDGESKIEATSPIIPYGWAGWELGTNKQVKKKADDVYTDRTQNPLHLDPSKTTFVFATPRRWAKKAEWAKARNAESIWKDVRVIDAVDLVQWLERLPAVALWFARFINKLPKDVSSIEQVWREWSAATSPPLSVQLVLADRDEAATRIWQWLPDLPNVLAVQADAPAEAKAFLYAAIEQYPKDYRDFFYSRTVAPANPEAARALADVGTPLIIVLEDSQPGLTNSLVEKGHHVFVALTTDEAAAGTALRRPNRYTIQEELRRMGIEKDQATNLAYDSARSLTILRRLMPSAPGLTPPEWATSAHTRYIVPALLTGAWDETRPADKRVLESLSGSAYDELARQLTVILHQPDSPLRKVGPAWKIASPRDAWFRLAPFITTADVEKFIGLAADVLGSADPRFNLEPDERWRADLVGEEATYSGLIRTGMAEILVLLNTFGPRASAVPNAGLYSGRVVKRLLGSADAERWWSLHRQLKILAEASPEEFLNAIENNLAQNDPPLMKLFVEGNDFFGGGGEYPHLLWALELLAWSPAYLARVTDSLAKLAQLDPGGRYSNRPANSFQQIFRLWYPQTSATLEQRNIVLKRLRKTYPEISWKLLLNLYPKPHDTATDNPVPRWRDFSAIEPEPATHAVIIRGAQTIGGWLLEDVGADAKRWAELFGRFNDFAPDLREAVVERLRVIAPKIQNDAERIVIQQALRKLINHHRQFPSAGWALPDQELQTLETAYALFEPHDQLLKIKWLFDEHQPSLLHPHEAREWEANNKAADIARREAIAHLLAASGIQAVLHLYPVARFPDLVGRAYAENRDTDDFPNEFIDALKADGAASWGFAEGAILTYFWARGEAWGNELLDRAIKEGWGDLALERILLALPKTEHFIARAAKIGGNVDARYWAKLPIYRIDVIGDERPRMVERLLEAKRARDAVHYAGQYIQDIPSPLLVRLLTEAVSSEASHDGNEATMFQHYTVLIFEKLDKDASVTEAQIARLEWAYLKLLEYSNRTPKALPKLLATSPDFFVEVLSLVYRGNHEQDMDETAPDYEQKKAMAGQAWTLLHGWAQVPGLKGDGTVNGTELETWVTNARLLCERADRAVVGDHVIGQMLAYAPADKDGTWPCLPVREVIEKVKSEHLDIGIRNGVVNKRGVTTRLPTDGGEKEREIADMYRDWGKRLQLEFPHTSKLLIEISKSFDWDAKYHDDDAEMRQW